MSDLFIRDLPDWTRAMSRTDMPFSRFPKLPIRPIIGYTKKTWRFRAWRRLYRLVNWPTVMMSCGVDPGDEEDMTCSVSWRPGEWAARHMHEHRSHPIYDPDWVDPAPTPLKVEWG